jgi:hypothetical protein
MVLRTRQGSGLGNRASLPGANAVHRQHARRRIENESVRAARGTVTKVVAVGPAALAT